MYSNCSAKCNWLHILRSPMPMPVLSTLIYKIPLNTHSNNHFFLKPNAFIQQHKCCFMYTLSVITLACWTTQWSSNDFISLLDERSFNALVNLCSHTCLTEGSKGACCLKKNRKQIQEIVVALNTSQTADSWYHLHVMLTNSNTSSNVWR